MAHGCSLEASWLSERGMPICLFTMAVCRQWLGQRMARLGTVITEAIVHHYGRDEFLRRLAHPFWFQSFGAVMGMD
jgi:hypothetical protein